MIIKGNKAILRKLIHNSRQKLIPFRVFFELTYKCNLKCKHCMVVEDRNKQELTYEQICRIIDQIAEFGCLYINFTGGEPLVRKEFFEITSYAKMKKLAFTIQTNGTLITSQVADKIAALFPLQVSISLLGTRNIHDRIVGIAGSYKRTIEAVKLLRERKVRVCITTVIMRQNAGELPRIKRFTQQAGVSWAPCSLIVPKFDGSQEPFFCRALDRQLKDSIKRYCRVEIDEDKRSEVLDSPLCNNAGGSSTTITAYGDLNPCPAWMRDQKRNLLKNKTFSQIWRDDGDFKRLRILRKKELPVCRDCNLLLYCNVCPVLNFFEKGDIMLPATESCRRAMAKKEALRERRMANDKQG